MMAKVSFGGLAARLPAGWFDVTDDLPAGTPTTLAKSEGGIGSLQFSVAKYTAGKLPHIEHSDMQSLLEDFARTRRLGEPIALTRGRGEGNSYVTADFRNGEELVRVWYVSNGRDLALATFVVEQSASSGVDQELSEANQIVTSLEFL